jgi:predicted O-methyltransferase YrrM
MSLVAADRTFSVGRQMDTCLGKLKIELERFGETNDSAVNERGRRMFNVTRDTGEFLAVQVLATAARRVLEIGTSNGYSTLWLADAAQTVRGSVTTVERDDYKAGLASVNFARSGLAQVINLVKGEATSFLRRTDKSAYDLIFLDSERREYVAWWPDVRRALRPGGLLIVDNATSHAEDLFRFRALVTADPEFATCLVPVGKGEFLAVKGNALD